LEILVHLQQHQVPEDYVLMKINIHSKGRTLEELAERLKAESLLRERRPIWAVRSVIIPQERNLILFPEHREFQADVVSIEKFAFDPRLVDRVTAQ
jgi:hypothetical protein